MDFSGENGTSYCGDCKVAAGGAFLVSDRVRCAEDKQLQYWRKWPRMEDWPDALSVDEAAAFRRISPDFIRRSLKADRSGRAALRHQRFGAVYRISKEDLLGFGLVEARKERPKP